MAARVSSQQLMVAGAGTGKARVSSQQLMVAGAGTGAVRVSAQQLMVIGPVTSIVTGDFDDTLSFSEDLTLNTVLGVPFSDSVAFSDTVTGFTLLPLSDSVVFSDTIESDKISEADWSDTLTLTDDIAAPIFVEFEDDLTLDDDVEGEAIKIGNFDDLITFTSDFARLAVLARTTADLLTYTEVLSRNFSKLLSISDSVSLSDTIAAAVAKVLGDSFSFSDAVSAFVSKLMRDTIDFVDFMQLNVVVSKGLQDYWIPADTLTVQTIIHGSMSETLTLNETMVGNNVRFLTDIVVFTDTLDGIVTKPLSDTLTYTETVGLNKSVQRTMSENLFLNDDILPQVVLTRTLAEVVDFLDSMTAIRVKQASFTDTVSFTDVMYRTVFERLVDDEIVYDDTISFDLIAARTVNENLGLTDTLGVKTVLNKGWSDYLLYNDGFVVKAKTRTNFPDPGVTQPTPPPLPSLPPSAPSADIVYVSPIWVGVARIRPQVVLRGFTTSIVLPPPEFNNFVANQSKVITARSMSGSIRVYRKVATREKLNWRFTIPKYKADEFKAFLRTEINNQIDMVDWEANFWKVEILSNSVDFVETRRWSPCGNAVDVTIELVGDQYA